MTIIKIKPINQNFLLDKTLDKITNPVVKEHLSKYINQRLIESVSVWTLLDEILKEYFNTSLEKEKVLKTKTGKPYFENNQIYFSLSHTDGVVMCGVSNQEIGVDIEVNQEVSKLLLDKYHIDNSVDFLIFHTKKEARVKRLGTTIMDDIKISELTNVQTKEIIINNQKYIYSIDTLDTKINIITI